VRGVFNRREGGECLAGVDPMQSEGRVDLGYGEGVVFMGPLCKHSDLLSVVIFPLHE